VEPEQLDNIPWRLAERTPSIVQADWLARALGTTFAEIFRELENP
jgi:hypothetical protein